MPSAWRCWSFSKASLRPSGSPSSCTTPSGFRSTRSRRSSTARRPPPASSPAAAGAGCAKARCPASATDAAEQRRLVDAFFAAARAGDIDALVAVLDPEVVLRADAGSSPLSAEIRGAQAVAGRAAMFAGGGGTLIAATVNGTPGVVVRLGDAVVSVMEFMVIDGRIAAIHALADRQRLAMLPIPVG